MEPSFFTITACNRCRKRKAKCDTGIPACIQCQSSGSSCEFTDPRTKDTFPRAYIFDLESQVSRLEEKARRLAQTDIGEKGSLSTNRSSSDVTIDGADTDCNEHTDLIRLEPGGHSHYLGTSSGMHLARSVLESTRKTDIPFDRQETPLGSHDKGQDPQRHGQNDEDGSLTWDNNALPSLETAKSLTEIFFSQYQIQYCILDHDQFMDDVSKLYSQQERDSSNSNESSTRFMLNLVFSISLHLLYHDNPDSYLLAERFRMNATAQLGSVMKHKTYRTLQCLLLLLLSSMVDSRSSPVWYISGICMRMCVDLGFHSEYTIKSGNRNSDGCTDHSEQYEQDMKRRLFWVTYTFDRSLATILGRPFFLDDEHIDVEYPHQVLPETKRAQIIHWFKMQRIQSEIVDRLFTGRGPCNQNSQSVGDLNDWKAAITTKLELWLHQSRSLVDSDGHSMDWWRYWYQNATIMLHRPLPRGSLPSVDSLLAAYDSAKRMVHLSFIRVHKGLFGFTWLDLHYQVVSGLTLLFLVLKSPDARLRAQTDWVSFKSCTLEWQIVLEKLTNRWVKMERMKDVLIRLAEATVLTIEEISPRLHLKHSSSRIMHDRGYRESILQELGSPGSRSSNRHAMTSSPETIIHQNPGGNMHVPVNNCQPVPGNIYTSQESSSFGEEEPSPAHPRGLQSGNTPAGTWLDNESYRFHHHSEGLLNHLDLSSMLDEDIWSELNSMDASSQAQFALFDQNQCSLPMIGAETFGIQILGQLNGGLDATVTESVLNFQGNLDDSREG